MAMGASSISALRMEKSRVAFAVPRVTSHPGFKSESRPGEARVVCLSLGGSASTYILRRLDRGPVSTSPGCLGTVCTPTW